MVGSLARAIPSPYAPKKQAGPAMLAKESGPAAAPIIPVPQRPAVEVPAPTIEVVVPETHVENGTPRVSYAEERAAVPMAAPRRRFRLPLPSAAQFAAVMATLLLAAVITAIVMSRHPARSPLNHVSLSLHNNCVLTDQAAIKPFEDDIHTLPVADKLRGMIASSKDQAFIKSVTTGLQHEIAQHEIDVTLKYLQDGKAEVIAPGTYDTVAYLDDNGALVVAKPGQPWAALMYRGGVVYAYLGADFRLNPQQ